MNFTVHIHHLMWIDESKQFKWMGHAHSWGKKRYVDPIECKSVNLKERRFQRDLINGLMGGW